MPYTDPYELDRASTELEYTLLLLILPTLLLIPTIIEIVIAAAGAPIYRFY